MVMPNLPTRNNQSRHFVLWTILEQLQAIAEQYDSPAPDLPESNNATDLEIGVNISKQLRHIGNALNNVTVSFINIGEGVSGEYESDTDGAQVLAEADAAQRVVFGTIQVTEAFADGAGAQPTFTIGDTDDPDRLVADTLLADAALNSIFFFAGIINATDDFIVTATAATGDGTGAISVTASIFPVTPA